ncbi:alpha/beta hydrolase [Nocardioides mangrovicus]|uniref:Alpha/beta hydrolase n=1 Tax=Nocardioides mangrovicus TaxID=2478913 RepID=A0A3L8P0R0_9ACTN|nr:alpha/beta fold hydrolase [Nocardioides mangrovicus]RLV48472.1 alpha/beta hydrolase [Nocardioides mangrovicus]
MHRLIDVHVPSRPAAAVLLLHGGAARGGGTLPVSPTQLSVLRMVPIGWRLALARPRTLAVFRVLNSHRGWDTTTTPVADATWAMDQVRDRLGRLPLGLVGHSLGGRAAILAGDQPDVRSVVALNPWLYPSDHQDLTGRAVLIVHGSQDRIASPANAATVAARLRRETSVEEVSVPGGKHAMLRHGAAFERAATRFTVDHLLG